MALGKPTFLPTSEDFYVYAFPRFTAIAPLTGTQVQSVTIQADSDFQLEFLTYTADIAGATQTDGTRLIPNATILITDTGSGRQLMNQGVPIPSFMGYGAEPFKLSKPKQFGARATVQAQITSYEAAITLNIFIVMIGRKVFHYP